MYHRPRTSQRHRVFVSYYHKEDQHYRDWFERSFSDFYDIYVKDMALREIGKHFHLGIRRASIKEARL